MILLITMFLSLSSNSSIHTHEYFQENYSYQDEQTYVVSLTDLFTDQEKYRNKSIIVKGKVVKVNPNILGKNWIHIQDGTKDDAGELHDLTITSAEMFELDDQVVIKGKITLDKDFGSGYFYEIIMEEARLYKKKI